MASGLALRTLLRRNKTTAIIGAVQNVTRPENIRMKHLLDLQVETVSSADFANFDRIATVDVQPHYFGGALERCDLVVDHHPEQANHNAVFKDIRPDYGSTCTILTEHLRAVDMDISERVATAMLYAIKSDTLFFARQTNRVDLDAFSHLYPLADAALIRKMEGADLSLDRLEYVTRAVRDGTLADQVFTAFLGKVPREDCITYAADFFLDLEDVRWTVISGVVNEMMIISVRNLGYSRNAGDFVKKAVRRHRQRRRPSRHGQGGGPDPSLRREVRRHRPGPPGHADPLSSSRSSCTTPPPRRRRNRSAPSRPGVRRTGAAWFTRQVLGWTARPDRGVPTCPALGSVAAASWSVRLPSMCRPWLGETNAWDPQPHAESEPAHVLQDFAESALLRNCRETGRRMRAPAPRPTARRQCFANVN